MSNMSEKELTIQSQVKVTALGGHRVEFTIGNRTFKSIEFSSKKGQQRAEAYRSELHLAFDELILHGKQNAQQQNAEKTSYIKTLDKGLASSNKKLKEARQQNAEIRKELEEYKRKYDGRVESS